MVHMTKFRAGIIGCGRIAGTIEEEIIVKNANTTMLLPHSHAGAYKDVPEVELVAASEVVEKKLTDFGRRWNVSSLYTNYEEMLKKESLDIVSISASTSIHYPATLKAAESGVKAIFCEKPIAETLAEADRMIDVCDQAGVRLIVNHYRRWNPYYRRAKELVDLGRIGELVAIVGYNPEPLLYGGTHLFDQFRYYGGDVDWVFGHIDDIDYLDEAKTVCKDPTEHAGAFLHFKNGVHGLMALADGWDPYGMWLIGKSGKMHMGSFPFELYEGDKQVPFPAAMKHTSGMVNAVREIVECIETGKESISSGRDGRAALELVTAILESQRNAGKIVQLPLKDSELRITMAGGIYR